MELFLLVATFFGTLAIGVPVAVCLGLSSLAYILAAGLPVVIIPQRMYAGMDVFVLLCIPGFILAGNLMNFGGITERIIRLANAMVGWMRGGLAMANVADSMLFGGVSGTAVADVAATGGVMIPGMKKSGYPADFAAAITAASKAFFLAGRLSRMVPTPSETRYSRSAMLPPTSSSNWRMMRTAARRMSGSASSAG